MLNWTLLSLAFIACGSADRSDEALLHALTAEVDTLKSRPGEELILNAVTEFDWERVFLFLPFTRADQINEQLGFDWDAADRTRIAIRDDIVLLVFVSGDRVIRFIQFPRRFGDFSEIEVNRGLTPSEARFRVEIPSENDTRIVLQLAS